MPWLKLLHICAVIVWCGSLLYLPAMVAAAGGSRSTRQGMGNDGRPLLRTVYTGVATPAALVAIASGTWLFATQGPMAPWLMAKLALVGLLVLGHGVGGMLVLRSERGELRWLGAASGVLAASTLLWLVGIATLVLRKPEWP